MEHLARRRRLVTRPSIILLAIEAPVADAEAINLHRDLANRASIVWVVTGEIADLLSDPYREGSTVLIDRGFTVRDIYEHLLRAVGSRVDAAPTTVGDVLANRAEATNDALASRYMERGTSRASGSAAQESTGA